MSLILDGTTGVPVTTVTGTLPVANGGTGVTTSTGSGANVLGTSPTLTTPVIDSATVATVSGTAPLYMCRAWVNFDGTGTPAIRASGNVSSITDNGTGDYTVNFTTAMSDANYSVVGTAKIVGGTGGQNIRIHNDAYTTSVTTTAVKVQVTSAGNAATADSEMVNIAVFR